MKDPAFLFYSQDFIVGTLTMSFSDRGKYITILSFMHQKGRLSEKNIKNLVGCISPILKEKFAIDHDGFWYNIRLEKAIEERVKYVERCKLNGSKGGRPKNPDLTQTKPMGLPNDNQEPNPEITISFSSSNNITISNDIVKPKKYFFIDSLIGIFRDEYLEFHKSEYTITAIGKERKAASTILQAYRKKNKEADSEKTIKELKSYFKSCINISDTWLNQNMSLSIIVSKFNEINQILRNGNKRKTNNGATGEDIMGAVIANVPS